jgi:hypothetical protein
LALFGVQADDDSSRLPPYRAPRPLRSGPPLRISGCGAVEWRGVTTHPHAHSQPFRLCWGVAERTGVDAFAFAFAFPRDGSRLALPNPNPQTTAPFFSCLGSDPTVSISYDSLPPGLSDVSSLIWSCHGQLQDRSLFLVALT